MESEELQEETAEKVEKKRDKDTIFSKDNTPVVAATTKQPSTSHELAGRHRELENRKNDQMRMCMVATHSVGDPGVHAEHLMTHTHTATIATCVVHYSTRQHDETALRSASYLFLFSRWSMKHFIVRWWRSAGCYEAH